MDAGVFEKMGLTRGEARTYAALLELGESTTGPLISGTHMQKSTVYLCLERLLEKGLIAYVIKNNRKHFTALPPDSIIEYLSQKENEVRKQKEEMEKFIPKILAAEQKGAKAQSARLFVGWNGMKSAFEDILRSVRTGETYFVFGVTDVPQVAGRLRRFLSTFHSRRDALGIRVKLAINEDLRRTIGADRKKERYSEVRFIGAEFSTPAVINVYNDKTLIAIWNENPAAVLIENRETAESFRNYFKLIWSMAKK